MINNKQKIHLNKLAMIKKGQPSPLIGRKFPVRKNAVKKIIIKCPVCNKKFISYPSMKRIYCSTHCWEQIKKGKTHPSWNGGKCKIDGYIYIYNPRHPFTTKGRYVCEHRLIMEKSIGRFLTKNEVVHHINRIRDDNRIENLIIMTDSKHKSFHIRENNNK